jgi:hypothetical protein
MPDEAPTMIVFRFIYLDSLMSALPKAKLTSVRRGADVVS